MQAKDKSVAFEAVKDLGAGAYGLLIVGTLLWGAYVFVDDLVKLALH